MKNRRADDPDRYDEIIVSGTLNPAIVLPRDRYNNQLRELLIANSADDHY